MTATAYRSSVFHCLADPGSHSNDNAVEYLDDGLLIVITESSRYWETPLT